MPDRQHDVKPASALRPPAVTEATGPGSYTRWRSAHFSTAADLSRLVERAGLTVDAIRGSVYYPPIGLLARAMAPLDQWLGSVTTVGAAFIAVAATRNVNGEPTQTASSETPSARRPGVDSAP